MNKPQELSWIELSRKALKKNITSLVKLAGGRKLAICVKANAYGHGLPEIVKLLTDTNQVDCLTVHSLEEAEVCRDSGWLRPIMVLGPIPHDRLESVLKLNLEPVICDRSTLSRLGKLGDKAAIRLRTHLKLETGTNRQGISSDELGGIAAVYKKHASLQLPYGASSHFANIEDTTNHEYAEYQLKLFNQLVRRMTKLGIKPRVRHTACSAALILFDKTRFDLVRPGISAYGHWSSKETYLSYRLDGGGNDLFTPVLSWKTRITQLKKVPSDSFIGYGCTYRTTTPSRLAVLPIGYADGYDRSLSNVAHVLIHGRRAPVRGRVCMNIVMVDVTHIKGVRLHDEVTLIGSSSAETVTAEQLAAWAGTINYEILARIGRNLLRIVK
ncbi:MAG: alanine racemase [candidate division Zixibacteria bacterium]|nr:alanine racemase [candidate division Zixibacteria bacterium]